MIFLWIISLYFWALFMSSIYICKISLIRKLLGWRKGGVEGVCCPTATYTGTYIYRYTGTQVHRYTDLYFKYTFSRHMMWSCKAPVTKNKLLNFKFCKIIKTIQYILPCFPLKGFYFRSTTGRWSVHVVKVLT